MAEFRGIEVKRQGLDVAAGAQVLSAARARFARDHVVRLRGFFGGEMLAALDRRLPTAAFSRRFEDGREIELTLEDPSALALTVVALNDPALFAVIDRITGCGAIGCFSGRVHARHASAAGGHYYPWHTDAARERLVGISVNLGDGAFCGGVLEMRRVGSDGILAHVPNSIRGDAVLFRISPDLEHHVTPVTSSIARLVLAGWFRATPDFWREARGCA